MRLIDKFYKHVFGPNLITMNQPGVVYNTVSIFYGLKKSKKRTVYHFEWPLVRLLRRMRDDERFLFDIGYRMGYLYIQAGSGRRIPSSMQPRVLQLMTDHASCSGIQKRYLRMKGGHVEFGIRDPIICKQGDLSAVIAGIISGLFSPLMGEYMQPRIDCTHCPASHTELRRTGESPHVQTLDLKLDKRESNYPRHVQDPDLPSFKDALKHGKVQMGSDMKNRICSEVIISYPPAMINVVPDMFREKGHEDLLEEVVKGGRETMERIRKCYPSTHKLDFLRRLLSICGWGIPHFKRSTSTLTATFKYPPLTAYGMEYQALELQGLLEGLLDKRLRRKDMRTQAQPPLLTVRFTERGSS